LNRLALKTHKVEKIKTLKVLFNPKMAGGFLPTAFYKYATLLAIVEPHGNQTSHKAKGAYSDLKFRALKAHPI